MSKNFDGFIEQQISSGETVTPELIAVNTRLKEKDMAQTMYAQRSYWCKIGLHKKVLSWDGGAYKMTCTKCWRHKL